MKTVLKCCEFGAITNIMYA